MISIADSQENKADILRTDTSFSRRNYIRRLVWRRKCYLFPTNGSTAQFLYIHSLHDSDLPLNSCTSLEIFSTSAFFLRMFSFARNILSFVFFSSSSAVFNCKFAKSTFSCLFCCNSDNFSLRSAISWSFAERMSLM